MQISIPFRTLDYARTWGYNQVFEEIMFLIFNKEDNEYRFVNESKLFYLQQCFVLDMDIIETWE
tara:strand:- start:92 stop:283 length:192 start_codon:yes stop_codon:yes gene_type:complete